MGKLRSSAGVSPRRVAGFACHQGFLYSLFYMGMNREYSIGSFAVERVELLGTLAAMVVTLVVMNVMARRAPSVREVMLERHSVIAYAVALVIGAFVPVVMGSLQTDELVFESIMVGVPWALMLLAWARRLARGTTEKSTVEVSSAPGWARLCAFSCILCSTPGPVGFEAAGDTKRRLVGGRYAQDGRRSGRSASRGVCLDVSCHGLLREGACGDGLFRPRCRFHGGVQL